ncbi:NAD(P)/FAD-dependent oxidoreductase [Janibacter anophelis]|uniref:NAD(P)/FAD-dependent oxidoreductase n=1 Tax=Janibacter anophelis TaxID=319054 RepID=UPI000DF012F6|nr:FAD-dependent oxidoreductase [Janibacter anophelis]
MSTSAEPQRIVVVGAGECGTHAAMALRDKGFDGSITLIGRESVHAYERPPLSKGALSAEETELVHPWSPEQLAEAGIDLQLGVEVTGIDLAAGTVTTDAGEVPWDRLLLALGSDVRRLELDDVTYLRTHEDAAALRELLRPEGHLLVIGAGFIGLEIAAGARERGMEVTVVEAGPRALGRIVPQEVAEQVVALHAEHGVALRTSTLVTDLRREGGRLRALLSDGDEVVVDVVVAGVGAAPTTALAAAAGLVVDDGIVVDEGLRTSDPRVFAAGDCASFPDARSGGRVRLESWRNAHDQAVTVAASMLGEEQAHAAVPWFWSDQYDQMLSVAGLPGTGERSVLRHRDDGVLLHLGLDAADRLVHAAAVGPGASVAKDIRVAEKLIAAAVPLDPEQLADPGVPLRSILKAATA